MKPAFTVTLTRVAFGMLASWTAWFLGLESLALAAAIVTVLVLVITVVIMPSRDPEKK